MNHLNIHKTALAFGTFTGLVHLVWSVLIALGWAEPLMSFALRMHSLNNPYTISAFDLTRSVELVILTAVIGYIVGTVFAHVWNRVGNK